MKYDAFISYRHVPRDIAVAENLHKMLEHYRVPKNVQKMTGKKKIHRVFRDRDELPLADNLTDNLLTALDESEYLLVICSPESRESMWVQREVEYFVKTHDRQHVLAILTSGEPDEAFPELILHEEKEIVTEDGDTVKVMEDVEPLAADVRADSIEKSIKILKKEKLRVLAALLGCEYNDLKQRHKEAMMRRAFALTSIIITVLTCFSIYAYRQNVKITTEYTEKQISQSRNLARFSQENLANGDRDIAILLALEALPKSSSDSEKPLVSEAVNALTEAVYAYQTPKNKFYFCKHVVELAGNTESYGMQACQISPKGTYFSAFDDSEIVQIYETSGGKMVFRYKMEDFDLTPMEDAFSEEKLMYANFLSEEEMLIVSSQHIFAVELESGRVIWQTLLPEENPYDEAMLRKDCAKFSEDRRFFMAYYYGRYFVYDLTKHEFLIYGKYEAEVGIYETDATLSPDGKKLILCFRSSNEAEEKRKTTGNIKMVDMESGAMESLPIPTPAALTATFLSDGDLLLLTTSMIPSTQLDYTAHVNYQLVRYDFERKKSGILYSGENGYQYKSRPSFIKQEVTLEDGSRENRIAGFIGNQFFILNEKGEMISQVLAESPIVNLQSLKDNRLSVGLKDGTVARYSFLWNSRMPLKKVVSVDKYDMAGAYYQEDQNIILQIPYKGNRCIINAPLYDENYRILPIEGEIKKTGYISLDNDFKKTYRSVGTEDHIMVWSVGTAPQEEKLVADLKAKEGGTISCETLFKNEKNHLIVCYSEIWDTEEGKKIQRIEAVDSEDESILWSHEGEISNPTIFCAEQSSYIIWVNGINFSVIDKLYGEVKEIDYKNSFCNSKEDLYTYSIDFSSDGTYAIWVAAKLLSDKKTVFRYDMEKDSWEIFPGLDSVEKYIDCVEIARKSNQMAYCKDGTSIDIYDIDTMEITQQIPIHGKSTAHYAFMENEKYLLYQSDDQIFRSVNLETKEIVMEDTEAYNGVGAIYSMDNSQIIRITASRKSNQVYNMYIQNSLYLFWMEDDGTFSLYTQIPDGFASIAANEVLELNPDQDTSIGVYPLYDLDHLIERAKEIIGDRTLSQTEKVRYFIENN